MAEIPDPTNMLTGKDRELFDHMASVRAHAEGRSHLGDVYVRMFNNPGVAEKVGALGEHLRFHGSLPDDLRELVILRFASKQRFQYEWSHHQHPAKLAGISPEVMDALLTAGEAPKMLPDASQAAIEAVDAIISKKSIPADVQQRFVLAYGVSGLVEIVAICGLYTIMGYMTTAFDIQIEEGLPKAPF
ncbi:MAG: carboxymuconolactone decarboxylase family protein [Deltaproteobacteria bacterium]|nr:carboxymuconolactone decarboxylase family protein [Deltaproteobacteria bacterium]